MLSVTVAHHHLRLIPKAEDLEQGSELVLSLPLLAAVSALQLSPETARARDLAALQLLQPQTAGSSDNTDKYRGNCRCV